MSKVGWVLSAYFRCGFVFVLSGCYGIQLVFLATKCNHLSFAKTFWYDF